MKMKAVFKERIEDDSKVSLSDNFISFVFSAAKENNLSPDDVWSKWQKYTRDCTNFDQSPLLSEFKQWYNL